MKSFEWEMRTRIVWGRGSLSRLGEETAEIAKRALLLTGRSSMEKHGYLARARKTLADAGVSAEHFSGIEPNPLVSTVDRAVDFLRDHPASVIVALGGGSTMDAAKFISACYMNGGSAWDYVPYGGREPREIRQALPIVAVPTVPASGSEANPYCVVTNDKTREKSYTGHPMLAPKVCIWDPELTLTVGLETMKDGAMDMLCHLLEPYLSCTDAGGGAEVVDRISEGLILAVLETLPALLKHPEDLALRERLCWISTLALCGVAFEGRDGPFPIHEMEHPLSGHYDIPHGRGLAILLPRYFRHCWKMAPERFAKLGRRCFGVRERTDAAACRKTLQALVAWMKKCGVYRSLAEAGIRASEKDLESLAEEALRITGLRTAARPPDPDSCAADRLPYRPDLPAGTLVLDGPQPLAKEDILAIYRAS